MSILPKYGYRPERLDTPENSEKYLGFLTTNAPKVFWTIEEKVHECLECGFSLFDLDDLYENTIRIRCKQCKRTQVYDLSNFERQELDETITLLKGIVNLPKGDFRKSCEARVFPHNVKYPFNPESDIDLLRVGVGFFAQVNVFGLSSKINFHSSNVSELPNNRSRRISQRVKNEVWRRDEGKCVQCGSNQNLEFDHIIPFSKGGANTYRNIQLLCEDCNRKKSDSIA